MVGSDEMRARKPGDGDSDRETEGPTVERTQHRAQAAAYQGAMEAVFAVVIAVGAGYWADNIFETSPRYLFTGVVIGFGAFVLRLMRMRPKGDPEDPEEPGSANGR